MTITEVPPVEVEPEGEVDWGDLIRTDRLFDILTYIEAHPEEWYQGLYAGQFACGTKYCVAGHAALRAGDTPDWSMGLNIDDPISGGQRVYSAITTMAKSGYSIFDVAMEYLNLDDDDACNLFAGRNTLVDLWMLYGQFVSKNAEVQGG